jgi:hypothetical protein
MLKDQSMAQHPVHAIATCLLLAGSLGAADVDKDPRVGGQALIGTTGLEPGAFAEFTFGNDYIFVVRPELFLNDDADLGFGGSALWQIPWERLEDHSLYIGPRVVDHNNDIEDVDDDDGYGLELGALAIYNIPFGGGQHNLELLGAVGFVDEEDTDGDSDLTIGFSVGLGYAFQF